VVVAAAGSTQRRVGRSVVTWCMAIANEYSLTLRGTCRTSSVFACGEQASGFGPRSAKVQRTVRALFGARVRSPRRILSFPPVSYRFRTVVCYPMSGQRELHRQL